MPHGLRMSAVVYPFSIYKISMGVMLKFAILIALRFIFLDMELEEKFYFKKAK
jgi:hypothetical protein